MDDATLLRRLDDIEQIKQLKARYFRCMDQKQFEGWKQVFARDAHLEVPEGNASVDGCDAIIAYVSGVLTGVRTVHHGHMPEIEITGADTAKGIWAMFDFVEFPPAEGGARQGLQGYGHYIEEYVREDGEWRIKSLLLTRLRIDPLDGGLPGVHQGVDSGRV
jgi:hypothetical protein